MCKNIVTPCTVLKYIDIFLGEATSPLKTGVIEAENPNWRVIPDLATDASILEVINDAGEHYIPDVDMQTGRKALECYSSQGEDFNSVRGETWWRRTYQRGDWRIKIITRTVLTSSATDFYLRGAYR